MPVAKEQSGPRRPFPLIPSRFARPDAGAGERSDRAWTMCGRDHDYIDIIIMKRQTTDP
jgi:hypothetical protein